MAKSYILLHYFNLKHFDLDIMKLWRTSKVQKNNLFKKNTYSLFALIEVGNSSLSNRGRFTCIWLTSAEFEERGIADNRNS